MVPWSVSKELWGPARSLEAHANMRGSAWVTGVRSAGGNCATALSCTPTHGSGGASKRRANATLRVWECSGSVPGAGELGAGKLPTPAANNVTTSPNVQSSKRTVCPK